MKPKFVALVDRPDAAYAWWRITRPFSYLQQAGYQAAWCWFTDQQPMLDITNAVVILQRVVLRHGNKEATKQFMSILRSLGPARIYYEVDDDIFSESYKQYLIDCGRIGSTLKANIDVEIERQREIVSLCDRVITTNITLGTLIQNECKTHVTIIPNFIDSAYFKRGLMLKPHPYKMDLTEIIVGWAGGLRPEYELEAMAKAWGYIASKYDRVKFVVGGYQPDIIYQHVPIERIIRVPYKKLVDWPSVMQVDIGCVPLADTPFNRCKSPIKIMEFALAGASVISSPIMYKNYFGQSETGCTFVSSNDDVSEWVHYIEEQIVSKQTRNVLANMLYNYVLSRWTLERNYEKWLQLGA